MVDRGLAALLAGHVSPELRREVDLVCETLPLNERRRVPRLESAAQRKPEGGWDVLVYANPRSTRTKIFLGHQGSSRSSMAIDPSPCGLSRTTRR